MPIFRKFSIAAATAAMFVLSLSLAGTAAAAGERGAAPVVVAQSQLPNWAGGLIPGAATGKPKDGENQGAAQSGTQPAAQPGGTASPPAADAAPAAAPASSEQATSDGASPASATPVVPPAQLEAVLQPARRITSLLDELDKTVERVKERDDELARARIEIDKLQPEARNAIEAIRPRLADVRSQIDKLGPAPGKDQPPEAASVAAERQRLNSIATQLDGAIKSAELAQERARQLTEYVQELRQKIFAQQVLRRTQHSPLKPSLWKTVAGEMPNAASELAAIGRGWWRSASDRWLEVAGIFALSLFVYFGLRHLRRRLIRSRLSRTTGGPPKFFERAAAASWVAPAIAVPAIAAGGVFYVGLDSNDLLYLQSARFVQMVLVAGLIFVVVKALSRAILQPSRSEWRLFNLSDSSARRLNTLTQLVAFVYGTDLVMKDLIKMLYLPFQVSVAQAFLFSLMFAGLMFMLARTPMQPRSAGENDTAADQVSRWHPVWLKVPMLLFAFVVAGASLLGYVALGRYISAQVVLTGTAIVAIVLLHLAIRAISGDSSVPGEASDSLSARVLGGRLKLDDTQQRQMDRIVYVALNLLLVFVAGPLLLATWGFSAPEILALVNSAVFGFQIGGVHISPTRILLAIGLFVALLFATRLLQRWLSATVLQPSRIDTGLANSIHTGIGYAGYAIAALAAISYGGLDITNLAIVAGALSVGIGFGLQSIVNNFVSGLILLVERPIKVGDWIAVGAHEGHVRRISVRSTEIETFDRSSVIVPNSELISGTVKNRTHRNALGRVDVMVGVAYESDPEEVRALLEKITLESPLVLKFPAPVVSFDNFAASSLDFTVRAYVGDVNKSVSTATDLRLRIFKALKDAGIEIPFPQTDVHLRDLDFVKTVVGRVAAERAMRGAVDGAAQPKGPDASQQPDSAPQGEPPKGERPPRNIRSA